MRAMIMNSSVRCAARSNLLGEVWDCVLRLRDLRAEGELRFAPVLSSMMTADTPMRSSVRL